MKPQTQIKELPQLYEALTKLDYNEPPAVVISGSDTAVFDLVLSRIKEHLKKEIGPFELFLYSGEQGDGDALRSEAANIPLFAPYRLFVVRQAEIMLRNLSGVGKAQDRQRRHYADFFANLPFRTLVVLQFSGTPPPSLLKIFGERLLAHNTRDLYPNEIVPTIQSLARRHGLTLSESAVQLMRDHVDLRSGAIELMVHRLKELLPREKRENVVESDLHDLLFPAGGVNSFQLVDNLFARNREAWEHEMIRYNPANDNLLGILKLMLMRANEIRRFLLAGEQKMSHNETIDFLEIRNRPPFVQKKIVERLELERSRFTLTEIVELIHFLVELQIDFKSQVPADQQLQIFKVRVAILFFGPRRRNAIGPANAAAGSTRGVTRV